LGTGLAGVAMESRRNRILPERAEGRHDNPNNGDVLFSEEIFMRRTLMNENNTGEKRKKKINFLIENSLVASWRDVKIQLSSKYQHTQTPYTPSTSFRLALSASSFA
jgi:hypothetical protein